MAKNEPAPFQWANVKSYFGDRSKRRSKNNLGVIELPMKDRGVFRSSKLDVLDTYFENKQYAGKMEWDEAICNSDDYIAVRQRKPRIIYPFASTLADRLSAKLIGESVFPRLTVTDSPDDQAYLAAVIAESNLRFYLADPIKRTVATGSAFLRFYIVGGRFKIEWYKTKICYPEWQENGQLQSVRIQYVYADWSTIDTRGEPVMRWYRLDLNTEDEILFDNPEYERNVDPEFQEVSRTEHGMGFVQGHWFRTSEDSDDGVGFIDGIETFIDEFNYSLSQSSQAVGYNQDPQLTINGMDSEEVGTLIRSATKFWNMGREGKGEFLEAGLEGVTKAIELRDKVKQNISDITRVIVLDPEKIVGSAQSAKAMEVLYGPLKDLIDEHRAALGPQIKNLVLKMAMANLIADQNGIEVPIEIPPTYEPKFPIVLLKWPPLFQQTLEDLSKKVSLAGQAKTLGLIAPATATRYVAEDFGIEDIESELKQIEENQAAMAALNPFGGF